MTDERAVIRYISWRDLFPWLMILRTFRIAISPSLLALATVAVLLSSAGWKLGAAVFLSRIESGKFIIDYPQPTGPRLPQQLPAAVREYLPDAATGLVEPFARLAEPVRHLFDMNLTLRETAYYLFGLLVSLAIWAFAGGFITRQAVVTLASDQPLGIKSAAFFTCRRYLWYLLAPLYPLLGLLLIAAPIMLLGLPIRVNVGVGTLIAGLFWLFVMLAGLAATWLAIGLLFGWPLLWPAISAERDGEPFDAFSRSFSYVYGHPLKYLFYVVVAALFGALCLAFVQGVAMFVTEFGFWALAWGGGEAVGNPQGIRDLVLARVEGAKLSSELPATTRLGVSLMALAVGLVQTVATAYTFSFFWSVASAIYLLLRHDVDEKETDEVYLEPDPAPAPSKPTVATPPTPPEPASEPPVV